MSQTIVFIPGLVSDQRAWSAVAQNLAELGYATGIADLTGAGSITAMARAVLAQFPGDLLPVGHSMGGRVAMEVARLAPERVTGLVLVATGAHPLADGERANRERVIRLANSQGMQALCDQWLPPMLAPETQLHNPALYQSLQQMVLDAGAQVHERQVRALISRPDARPLLGSLSVPTLFVAGEFDGWSSPLQHQQMASLVAQAEVAVVQGVGHFLQVEAPKKFSQILAQWLERKGFTE